MLHITKNISEFKNKFGIFSILIILASCALTLDSFIFYNSKPSFLTGLSPFKVIKLLLESVGFFVFIFSSIFIFCGTCFSILLTKDRFLQAAHFLSSSLIAAMLSMTVFFIIERSMYNMFSVGVLGSTSYLRLVFFILFLSLFALNFYIIKKSLFHFAANQHRYTKITLSIIVITIVSSGLFTSFKHIQQDSLIETARPNIILIGGDGINVANTSAYGFKEETTPFLRKLKNETLFCENAYTNAAYTPGSLVSILNGIDPGKTRVFDEGFNLNEYYAKKNLPAELKNIGYQTFSIKSWKNADWPWTDVTQRNMQNAFDEIGIESLSKTNPLPYKTSALTKQIISDIKNKLGHALFLTRSENPYLLVNDRTKAEGDAKRSNDAIQVIENSKKPYFLIVHLLATNAPEFSTRSKILSDSASPNKKNKRWIAEHYNDAIREVDENIKRLFTALKKSNSLENTIVVIYSDHGINHSLGKVPLMIRFPNKKHSGIIKQNVQLIDIAPTILDSIGEEIPEWMDGKSLLNKDLDPLRPVFAFKANRKGVHRSFPLEGAYMMKCDRYVYIDYRSKSFENYKPRDNSSDCKTDESVIGSYFDELIKYLESKNLTSDLYALPKFSKYQRKTD